MIKNKAERILLNIWYKGNLYNNYKYKACESFLSLFSVLYQLIIKLRIYLYNKNILKHGNPKLPVIVVGNITVGGTGKTPTVIYLVELLRSIGLQPGVIIRGYGNKLENNKSIIVSDNDCSKIDYIGDEAKLIYNRLKCPVAVGKNRVESVNLLTNSGLCNIVISDDGLQHYKLARDLELCIIDGVRGFGNKHLLPRGPLRESINRLSNCDLVLIKNNISNQSIVDMNTMKSLMSNIGTNKDSLNLSGKCHAFNLKPLCFVNLATNKQYAIDEFNGLVDSNDVVAYSAIGNNQNFYRTLSLLGFNNITTKGFGDHYSYKACDFNLAKKQVIITTEKDAVKINSIKQEINNFDNIYYLKVSLNINKNFSMQFAERIISICKNYKNINIKQQDYVR